LIREPVKDIDSLFLAPMYYAEVGVANHVQRLLKGPPPLGIHRGREGHSLGRAGPHLALSDSQKDALRLALQSNVCIITGGPGVGKTTLVRSFLRILWAKRLRVTLCAPTGRAAKRLAESTGMEARTIHRTLEFDPQTCGFKFGKDQPLDIDLLVLDEGSIDVLLMNKLLSAIPDPAALCIVGDLDQLPSVGPEAVLQDLMHSGVIPTVRFTEVFCQAARSRIIVNAHRINEGKMPLSQEEGQKAISISFPPVRRKRLTTDSCAWSPSGYPSVLT
jgi:exodeoxyribonuclease V alpha subunit